MAPKQQRLGNYFHANSHLSAGTKRRRVPSKQSSLSRTGVWKQLRGYSTVSNNNRGDTSRFGECPMCHTKLPIHVLLAHAEECTGQIPKINVNKVENSTKQVSYTESVTSSSPCVNSDDFVEPISSDKIFGPSSQVTATPWWKSTSIADDRKDTLAHSSEPLPGLYIFEDFITEEEEKQILQELDGTIPEHRHEFLPWKLGHFNGPHFGKRWGVHCNLRDRRVDSPENPLPNFFQRILGDKLQTVKPMKGCKPNEANAIAYRQQSGHYLTNHVDDRQLSKEPIANLSMAGDCYMTFRNERMGPGKKEEKRVLLKRRTLQVLTGRARYDYSHGIQNCDLLSERRISVTMRESPLTKNKKRK